MKLRLWQLAALLALPYLYCLRGDFQADDFWFVGDRDWSAVVRAFGGDWLTGARGQGGWLRPLVRIAYFIDDSLWGLGRPWGYHLTNVAIHLVNVVLMGVVIRGVAPGRAAAGAVALAAFAWYPPMGATVAWISSRTDLLALTGVLAACALFVSPRAPIWLRLPLCAVAAAAGYLSKESAYLLPGFLGVLWATRTDSDIAEDQNRWFLFSASALALAGVLLLRTVALGPQVGYGGQFAWPGFEALALRLATWTAWSVLPLANARLPLAIHVSLAAMLLGALIVLGRGQRRLSAGGLAIWLLALLPVGNQPLAPVENARFFAMGGVGLALMVLAAARDRRVGARGGVVAALLLAGVIAYEAPWVSASRRCRKLVSSIIAHLPREALRVHLLSEEMEYFRYTAGGVHSYRGAKLLPFGQAKWMLHRFAPAPGRRYELGFEGGAPTEGDALVYLTSGRKVEVFMTEAPECREGVEFDAGVPPTPGRPAYLYVRANSRAARECYPVGAPGPTGAPMPPPLATGERDEIIYLGLLKSPYKWRAPGFCDSPGDSSSSYGYPPPPSSCSLSLRPVPRDEGKP